MNERQEVIRILACDDERRYLDRIAEAVYGWGKRNGIAVKLNTFSEPGEAIDADIKNEHQVALLDIEMPSMAGTKLQERLIKNNPDMYIIFITNYDEYVSEAFHRGVYTYIFKKNLTEVLPRELDRLWGELNDGSRMFRYKIQRTEYMVRFDRIKYIQSDRHSVELHMCGGECIRIYETMAAVVKRLPAAMFVKINRSNAINIKCVDEVTGRSVIMEGNEELPVIKTDILNKIRSMRMR